MAKNSNLANFSSAVPSSLGTANQVLAVNSGATALEYVVPSSGETTFIGLTDTPSSFGTSGQILKVNSGATGLEFADEASGGGGSFSAINVASRIITSNTTVTSTQSALSVGPIEVADGVSLTVSGRHLIL